MADYKHTLNLPKTNFPMRANLPRREPEILERWEKTGLVAQLRKARANDPPISPTPIIHRRRITTTQMSVFSRELR